MESNRIKELEAQALIVREQILNMSKDGGCFVGASLSCTDILIYLYNEFLSVGPDRLDDPTRDYLLLSKGHDVPALYGTLSQMGYFPPERLRHHLKTSDSIYWHPNRSIPGIEFHSGSLGHLLPVAVGIAYDCKIRKTNNRVVVVVGDGELDEGSCWEALLVANAYHLDNLIVVVDRNHFQANIKTEDLIPLEPLQDKFKAFSSHVMRINGHDFNELEAAFKSLPFEKGSTSVVIADTVRGKGVPSIEARADRWFCNFSESEVKELIEELHGRAKATLHSETLVVR